MDQLVGSVFWLLSLLLGSLLNVDKSFFLMMIGREIGKANHIKTGLSREKRKKFNDFCRIMQNKRFIFFKLGKSAF